MNIPDSIVGFWTDTPSNSGTLSRTLFELSKSYGSAGSYCVLKTSGAYAFNCCGAEIFQNLDYSFTSLEQKQNFVYYMRRNTSYLTHYALAASYQLKPDSYGSFGNVIQVLQELGATEVDKHPNRNHGPHFMHLFVWAPNLNDDQWWQFLDKKTGQPRWWTALSEEDQSKKIQAASGEWEFHLQQVIKNQESKKRVNLLNQIGYFVRSLRNGHITSEMMAGFGYELPQRKEYPSERKIVSTR